MTLVDLDDLIREAWEAPFRGWDFSWLADRVTTSPLPWEFREIVNSAAAGVGSMLDMGTGGGEFLATINSRPAATVATEGYRPNVAAAGERLQPLGVSVVAVGPCPDNNRWQGRGGLLPFRSGSIDLIINRHEAYSPTEIERVLAPGGTFVTQQVGSRDEVELLDWFERTPPTGPEWDLTFATHQLQEAGLTVGAGDQAFGPKAFRDVGAVVYYLKAVPWRVPGFDPVSDRAYLERLHGIATNTGSGLAATAHRFWLAAYKS